MPSEIFEIVVGFSILIQYLHKLDKPMWSYSQNCIF